MQEDSLYAKPRIVEDINDCTFYHTMDIPGYGLVRGEYDLRGNEHNYLGPVDFKGKRVLEIGTASGHLCFYMERQGADMVALDLDENRQWDIVPFAGYDYRNTIDEFNTGLRKINNSFWLCHRAFNSRARVVYSTVYDIPPGIGEFDISTLCATLVHFQHPFVALQKVLSVTREKVIITDLIWNRFLPQFLLGFVSRPGMAFIPQYRKYRLPEAWWFMPPTILKEFLGVLGFGRTTVRYFFQKYRGRRRLAYNIVASRS